jgi:hypothetical protein
VPRKGIILTGGWLMERNFVENDKALEKYQQEQMAEALRAERVGVPA